jgi:SAM-dependent methyltransferase
MPASSVKRLNWGCGPYSVPGWINSDRSAADGVDLCCDIRAGLPFEADELDYIVSIHALQDLPYLDVFPALRELRRVLKPGGVLRLGLPDLDKAVQAYVTRDPAYFYVSDIDAKSLGGKLITQIIWYGSVRTPFTFDFIEEALLGAGFGRVARCGYRQTSSVFPDIVAFDNRDRESLFVEALK